VTAAKPRVVVYDAPEGWTLEVDGVIIEAGVPTQITAAIADRISDRDDVTLSVGEVGDSPPAGTVTPTIVSNGDDNTKEGGK
jgi:hypothetical protein